MKKLPLICGFNKNSESGDDVFAPSIFLYGCNLRCPYCMNASLVTGQPPNPTNIEEVKRFVEEYECETVNISGGEPTCTPTEVLVNLIEEMKSWNVKVGMSTNGTNPDILRVILPLIDRCYMDFKTSCMQGYEALKPKDIAPDRAVQINVIISKSLLTQEKMRRNEFEYEVRTTLYPKLVSLKNIEDIGSIMRKDEKWVLQQFRNNVDALDSSIKEVQPYNDADLEKILTVAKKYCDNVTLRYV